MGKSIMAKEGTMKYLIFTTQVDVNNFVTRANQATGYPHGNTTNAVGYEKKFDETLFAVSVATVWAWPGPGNDILEGGRQYDMEQELLTPSEQADLKTFEWLIEQNWWGDQ